MARSSTVGLSAWQWRGLFPAAAATDTIPHTRTAAGLSPCSTHLGLFKLAILQAQLHLSVPQLPPADLPKGLDLILQHGKQQYVARRKIVEGCWVLHAWRQAAGGRRRRRLPTAGQPPPPTAVAAAVPFTPHPLQLHVVARQLLIAQVSLQLLRLLLQLLRSRRRAPRRALLAAAGGRRRGAALGAGPRLGPRLQRRRGNLGPGVSSKGQFRPAASWGAVNGAAAGCQGALPRPRAPGAPGSRSWEAWRTLS